MLSVQALPSAHDIGQLVALPGGAAMYHSSPPVVSIAKLPHLLEQSGSISGVQPVGQHSSASNLQVFSSTTAQWAEQVSLSPTTCCRRQPFLPVLVSRGSPGQLVGHEPSPSQVSPGSTTPL